MLLVSCKYKELRAIKINKLIDSEIFYGTTMNIMNITGHSKESTFLTYIGTHQNKDALADLFMQQAGVIW